MYIQLIDSARWVSPVLYIHSDEEEALEFINNWKQELIEWAAKNDIGGGTPLARLESNIAMCDLIHKLGNYYLETMSERVREQGKIQSWMKLYNEQWVTDEEVVLIDLSK